MKNINEVLKDALSPTQEMNNELKKRILDDVSKRKEQNMEKVVDFQKMRRLFPAAAAVAAIIILASSATVFAAIHYLSPKQVAHELKDNKLEAAFQSQDAVSLDEVQEIDGYKIRLMGMISGKDLSDFEIESDGELRDDRTYVVMSIQAPNGEKFEDDSHFGNDPFFVSPMISGYHQQ